MEGLPKQIEITQAELAGLIRFADREHPLPVTFGGGRVFLMRGQPGSFRALATLAALRSELPELQETTNR